MATNFQNNSISTSGGILPTTTNIPGDLRCRVELEADIVDIPAPYLGMIVYAIDTAKYYKVTGLKSKRVGLSTVENAAVDTYEEFITSAGEVVVEEPATDEEVNQAIRNIFGEGVI